MRIASSSRSVPSASALAVYSGVSKRHLHVALRREIVDFSRLHLLHDADEVGRVGHVAVVQEEPHIRLVRIVVQMIDAVGVERRRAALDAVDDVALLQQKFGQIGAVLAGHAGNQSQHGLPCVTSKPGGRKILQCQRCRRKRRIEG